MDMMTMGFDKKDFRRDYFDKEFRRTDRIFWIMGVVSIILIMGVTYICLTLLFKGVEEVKEVGLKNVVDSIRYGSGQ